MFAHRGFQAESLTTVRETSLSRTTLWTGLFLPPAPSCLLWLLCLLWPGGSRQALWAQEFTLYHTPTGSGAGRASRRVKGKKQKYARAQQQLAWALQPPCKSQGSSSVHNPRRWCTCTYSCSLCSLWSLCSHDCLLHITLGKKKDRLNDLSLI